MADPLPAVAAVWVRLGVVEALVGLLGQWGPDRIAPLEVAENPPVPVPVPALARAKGAAGPMRDSLLVRTRVTAAVAVGFETRANGAGRSQVGALAVPEGGARFAPAGLVCDCH